MKRIKHLYIALVALTAVSCVDDYFEANPPLRLDAPYAYVESSIAPTKDGIPLKGGEEVTFSINIVDAPGVLNSVNYLFSKGGEVVSHTFDQIIGQTAGSFDVTVKAPMNLDGTSSFTIEISDAQEDPKVLTITRVLDVSYLHEGPDFTIEIIDADGFAREGDVLDVVLTINEVPAGTIGAISVAGTAGTVEFDQAELDALIGAESGSVAGTLTVGPVVSTGSYSVSAAVTDAEQNRQVLKSDEITYICPTAEGLVVAGTYKVIAKGEAGDEYEGLVTTVTITQLNDGQYEVDDMSFGVYPLLYEDDAPEGVLNVCGTSVAGDASNTDQYNDPFTITGEFINLEDGVIELTWSNTFGDNGTVTLIKE